MMSMLHVTVLYFTILWGSITTSTQHNFYIDVEDDSSLLTAVVEHPSEEGVYHLITHGKPAHLLIDGEWKAAPAIRNWIIEQGISRGYEHINIYGCNFAKGTAGKEAIKYLENRLDLSIAASDDITGLNGDWDLEEGSAVSPLSVPTYRSDLQLLGTLPLKPGMAIATCGSRTSGTQVDTDPNGYVVGIYDIREPACDGNAPAAPENWDEASNTAYHDAGWTAGVMGEVFGVDLEYDSPTPDIFVAANGLAHLQQMNVSTAPGGTGGEIFRIDGITGAVTTLVSLPNIVYPVNHSTGTYSHFAGLGNISYNADNQVLYATNLDNGYIYVVDANTGAILQTLDPTPTVADPATPHTAVERYVYGIEYNQCDGRVYFSKPDAASPLNTQNIYSMALNPDGTLDSSSEQLETTVMTTGLGTQVLAISDIEFSSDCSQMLVSSRGLNFGFGATGIVTHRPHWATTYRLDLAGGTYNQTITYNTGTHGNLTNSGGGVSFGYGNYGACGYDVACDDAMIATSDALTFPFNTNTYTDYIYGLQISDIDGNDTGFPANSYYVDLDGELTATDKNTNFDVDVFTKQCAISACDMPGCDPVPVEELCSDGSETITLSCEAGTANVMWFNSEDCYLGTGCNLDVDITMIEDGEVGDTQCFYYTATTADGCDVYSCCPITITIISCCPTENCFGVTITKN